MFAKAIADLFKIVDLNKDGMIDEAEQEEAMKLIHSMTLPKARWDLSDMDTDGDGKISESEWQDAMQTIADKVRTNTLQVLERTRQGLPPREAAEQLARERVEEAMSYRAS